MTPLIRQLSQYAAYHRDRRNIATHLIGVPMIVLAVTMLLARPAFGSLAGWTMSPALLAAAAATLFYLYLDLRYGLVMGAALALSLWVSAAVALMPTAVWLAWGVGLFVVGWIIQFVGHHYEGRKPAFVDDVIGLLIGPLFVLAEAGFLIGWRRDVQAAVEAQSGPTRVGAASSLSGA